MPVLDSLLGLLGVDEALDMSASSTERLEWTPTGSTRPSEGMVASCP